MPSEQKILRLAVIGFGPRGLGAIEALASQANLAQYRVHIDIFDPFEWLGSGPNFDPDQSDECILNIPVRALDIAPPDVVSAHIQPFSDWSKNSYAPDDFPPRSDLGAYLNARFNTLCDVMKGRFTITHHRSFVTRLRASDDGWSLIAEGTEIGTFDEVLLTQGQPQTAPDKQLDRWQTHSTARNLELKNAYPANDVLDAARRWSDRKVAVRGMGLSTFDVVRLLTKGLGGTFADGQYHPSGKEPRAILPFSLDGLAPAAKPATQAIDDRFALTDHESSAFADALERATAQGANDAVRTICDALIPPVGRISDAWSSTVSTDDVRQWFDIERDTPGGQDSRDTVAALKSDIAMAYGRAAPSIGYVTGQIWRKLQNTIRHGFNPTTIAPDTASAIIAFDEGLKRFSYGPPVSASEELLILIEQDLVRVNVVDDPDVALHDKGWCLSGSDDTVLASVMIDAVLPSPALHSVTDPLVSSCMSQGRMNIFTDGLGAATDASGELNGVDNDGLCMLGRLTLGSVIAVDSLHDCFGESTHRWADGVMARALEGAT